MLGLGVTAWRRSAGTGGAPPAASGAAVLLADETNGFAADFTYATDAQRVAKKVSGSITEYAVDDFIGNAGTSPKQVFDASGAIVWSPHNMFLNSGVPVTQSVAGLIAGATYTMSVVGSGSLAGTVGASGTATAGAPATFIATGASGTFTKTGTLTQIQLNRGAVATATLATTAAARYGIALNHDAGTLAALGLLCEAAATNLLLNNTTLSTQSVTVTATAYTLSFWGTGTITLSGVSTAGPLVGTGTGNRVSLTFTPTAGSLTLTVSGTVSRAQLETGSFVTSPIMTFAASVTRTADNYNFLLSAIPSLGVEYSMYGRFSVSNIAVGQQAFTVTDGTATHYAGFRANTTARLAVVDGSSQASIIGDTLVTETMMSAAGRLAANDFAFSTNGAAVAVDTIGTLFAGTEVRFGGTNGVAAATFHVAKMMLVPGLWNNAKLQTQSVVT